MPRRPRIDRPGRLHHVINRGQDGQRIFQSRKDYRYFLSLLVRARRAKRILLHAYCLMPNHYHLLVESVDGKLSETMHWVQFRYAAHFNRTRDHAGHVFGQRFKSFPVTTRVYLLVLVRYIDRNPWKAKYRAHPLRFPWCSAFHHVLEGPRPRWLERRIVDCFLQDPMRRGMDRADAYRHVFRIAQLDERADELVRLRMSGRARGFDDLDVLVEARQGEVERWLAKRAEAAPGPQHPLALVDPGSVFQVVEGLALPIPLALSTQNGRRRDARPLLAIGLLRDLVGLTYEHASSVLQLSPATLRGHYTLHREALKEHPAYLGLVAGAMRDALALAFGEEERRILTCGALALS